MTQNLLDELVAARRDAERIQREGDGTITALKHRNDELATGFEVHKSAAKQAQADLQTERNLHSATKAQSEAERRLKEKAEDDRARAHADLEAARLEIATLRHRLARVAQVIAEGK